MTEPIAVNGPRPPTTGALPNLIIIGAMKCGTTALHGLLDQHPDIAMASAKELNFFFGPATDPGHDAVSTWHRGLEWYTRQFDGQALVRGEASPGYTSPDHPEAADRMASVVADARLVYLVRDPIDRAVSQYRHHQADGTEQHPIADALLDPGSQYIARGRYFERLAPFIQFFATEQILILAQEELLHDPEAGLERIYRFLGVQAVPQPAAQTQRWNVSRGNTVDLPQGLRDRLISEFADDVERFRELTGQQFAHWSI
jgi:hypothetical protein